MTLDITVLGDLGIFNRYQIPSDCLICKKVGLNYTHRVCVGVCVSIWPC